MESSAANAVTTKNAFVVERQPAAPVKARELFGAANLALAEGDMARAETLLLELVAAHPALASPYANLGLVFARTNRADEAMAMFMQAIALEPGDCRSFLQLARLQRSQFLFAAARSSLLACTARDPAYADAYLALGVLYELYTGELLAARTAYEHYQSLADTPDERVAIWIGELSRRLDASHQLAAGEF